MAEPLSSGSTHGSGYGSGYEPRYDSYTRRQRASVNPVATNTLSSAQQAPSHYSHASHATEAASYMSYGKHPTMSERTTKPSLAVRYAYSMCNYIYNPETGYICGRSPPNFLKTLSFYLCFYAAICGYFAFCFTAFSFGVLNDDYPHRTGDSNLLRMSPGLGFRPLPDWRTTLIRFEMGKEESFQLYTQSIQSFINQYENYANLEMPDVRQTECDIRTGIRADQDLQAVCKFKLAELGNCQKETMYGYARGLPCVMLKMNKIYGWLPDPTNVTETKGDILVECYGLHEADKDFLNHVRYFPSKVVNGKEYGFFSHTFYPYLVQAGYLPPVVMAQFTNITKNRLIMVECQLSGIKNMVFNPLRRLGGLRFEILMD